MKRTTLYLALIAMAAAQLPAVTLGTGSIAGTFENPTPACLGQPTVRRMSSSNALASEPTHCHGATRSGVERVPTCFHLVAALSHK